MKLNLRKIIEVPGAKAPFSCELSTDELDFPAIVRFDENLKAEGAVVNTAGILTLKGTVSAKMHCVCDRCGSEFDREKIVELKQKKDRMQSIGAGLLLRYSFLQEGHTPIFSFSSIFLM